MRKTRQEKLKAILRRQKEFERIKYNLKFSPKLQDQKVEASQQFNTGTFQNQEITSDLTNLSYLPKQLIKIGVITLVLILVQILMYLLIR